jgi:hypothetical protein
MTDRAAVDRLLVANRYLVLGTADADGRSWVTPGLLRATGGGPCLLGVIA